MEPAPSRKLLRDGPALAVATSVVSWIGMLAAAAAVAAVFAVLAALEGERSQQGFVAAIQTPAATWVMLLATQLAAVVVLFVACRVARIGVRERLGLAPAGLRGLDAALLVAATIVPFVLGLVAAGSVDKLVRWSDGNALTRMWTDGSRLSSALWVLSIAIVPGVFEEAFYRGFVQRTLLRHWRPVNAIALSSVLFGIAHGEPSAMAFAFVIGVWLGIVAWRTGSVALTMLMHAVLNGSWTAIQMLVARSAITDSTWNVVACVAIALGLAALVPAVRILRRCEPAASRATSTTWPSAGLVARVGAAALAAACVLYAVIPPGATPADSSRAPSLTALRERATTTVDCPVDGEVEFALSDDVPVRIALPPAASRVTDAIVMLDAEAGVIWLGYAGEVSGKGYGGIPTRGIVEQLVGGDPASLLIRFEDASARPVRAWVSWLRDQETVDAAFAQAAAESGWARRSRYAPPGE